MTALMPALQRWVRDMNGVAWGDAVAVQAVANVLHRPVEKRLVDADYVGRRIDQPDTRSQLSEVVTEASDVHMQ